MRALTRKDLAILRFSNGQQTVDLLNGKIGFYLREWRPQRAQLKGGGVKVNSPIAEGSQYVAGYYDNVVETFVIDVSDCSVDEVVDDWLQPLTDLAISAFEYWTSDWNYLAITQVGMNFDIYGIVWVEVRGNKEPTSRYAVVHQAGWPEDNSPFGPTLNAQRKKAAVGIEFNVERGHWMDHIPGEATDLAVGAYSTFNGRTLGNISSSSGLFTPTISGDRAYVGNKFNRANLTHIYAHDVSLGVFSANLLDSATAAFFLNPQEVNDAAYFGSNVGVADSGPFSSLVFWIDQVATGLTIVWEYYNGVAWVALTVEDGTDTFTLLGSRSIHWRQPTDWTNVVVNGINAYWVRARITVVGGGLAPGRWDFEKPYSVTWPYILIPASANIRGNLPALIQMILKNRSDVDGPGGSAPDLWVNRVIVGLRSMNRDVGTAISAYGFVAFLNISNEQTVAGVTLGTNTTFVTNTESATGSDAVYNPAGVEAMAMRARITINPPVAASFFGTYRMYLRCQQFTGTPGDIKFRVVVYMGGGAFPVFTSGIKTVPAVGAFSLIEMGRVTLVPQLARNLRINNLIQTGIRIDVEAQSTVGAPPDFAPYDVVLMPVDEWAADIIDTQANASSALGYYGSGNGASLNIDSALYFKDDIRCVVTRDEITAIWTPNIIGPAIVKPNASLDQKLWFLTARRYDTAWTNEDDWRSNHEEVKSIEVNYVQRWLGFRGTS